MPDLLNLANELLYLIASELDHPRDVAHLLQTSRYFASLCTPLLRNTVLHDPDAIHWAAQHGHTRLIRLLVHLHSNHDLNAPRHKDRTPVHCAAMWNHGSTITYLHRHGADIHARDIMMDTPLHSAVRYRAFKAVVSLLKLGVDINAVNTRSETPLHIAVRGKRPWVPWARIVKLLVDCGAELCMVDSSYCTPAKLARAGMWPMISEVLMRAEDTAGAWEAIQELPWPPMERRLPWPPERDMRDGDMIIPWWFELHDGGEAGWQWRVEGALASLFRRGLTWPPEEPEWDVEDRIWWPEEEVPWPPQEEYKIPWGAADNDGLSRTVVSTMTKTTPTAMVI